MGIRKNIINAASALRDTVDPLPPEEDMEAVIAAQIRQKEKELIGKAIVGYIHREMTQKDWNKVHKKELHSVEGRTSYKLYYGSTLVGAVDIRTTEDPVEGIKLNFEFTKKRKK